MAIHIWLSRNVKHSNISFSVYSAIQTMSMSGMGGYIYLTSKVFAQLPPSEGIQLDTRSEEDDFDELFV